ncbi:hypothetical protein PoB_000385000 [Plakobranchus ocellatus]|uniref:Uncharacterized protein n=1 Tax=Plakobranchus ocellatus TaxID=259542 RepID=A0AAV3Y2R8_9GAST|nr:hypothetical protein PoB_000385000 [Plakobranchus ocellatus]
MVRTCTPQSCREISDGCLIPSGDIGVSSSALRLRPDRIWEAELPLPLNEYGHSDSRPISRRSIYRLMSKIGGGVGGTVASESALRSAGTLLSRVRAPPPAPCPDGGPESLRSPCCGLAIYKNLDGTLSKID